VSTVKIPSDRKQVKVAEAARMLGCGPETVRRMIRRGYLTAHYMPGAGLTGAKFVPAEQVLAIAHGRRSFQRIDDAAEKGAGLTWKTADWIERDQVLQKKAGTLASIYGPEPIIEILKQLGVRSVGECNPDQQRALNGHLLRLAGYTRDSRTTQWRRRREAK